MLMLLPLQASAGGSSLNMASTCDGSQSSVKLSIYSGLHHALVILHKRLLIVVIFMVVFLIHTTMLLISNYLNYNGFTHAAVITDIGLEHIMYFSPQNYFQDVNYNLSISAGAWTVAFGAAPGFYVGSLTKYFYGFLVYFYEPILVVTVMLLTELECFCHLLYHYNSSNNLLYKQHKLL